MGSATGGDGGGTCPPTILIFNITPMGVAWKELTSKCPRPPNFRSMAEPLHKARRLGEPEALASGLVRVCDTRDRHTRQDATLYVPRSRTEMGRRRFLSRAPLQYNQLPTDMTELPVAVFSRHLKRHLRRDPG